MSEIELKIFDIESMIWHDRIHVVPEVKFQKSWKMIHNEIDIFVFIQDLISFLYSG